MVLRRLSFERNICPCVVETAKAGRLDPAEVSRLGLSTGILLRVVGSEGLALEARERVLGVGLVGSGIRAAEAALEVDLI